MKDKWPLYWIKYSLDTGTLIKTGVSLGERFEKEMD